VHSNLSKHFSFDPHQKNETLIFSKLQKLQKKRFLPYCHIQFNVRLFAPLTGLSLIPIEAQSGQHHQLERRWGIDGDQK
jgi:hypothetical protein